jgi:hypothetical protein
MRGQRRARTPAFQALPASKGTASGRATTRAAGNPRARSHSAVPAASDAGRTVMYAATLAHPARPARPARPGPRRAHTAGARVGGGGARRAPVEGGGRDQWCGGGPGRAEIRIGPMWAVCPVPCVFPSMGERMEAACMPFALEPWRGDWLHSDVSATLPGLQVHPKVVPL